VDKARSPILVILTNVFGRILFHILEETQAIHPSLVFYTIPLDSSGRMGLKTALITAN
jgi:hypothetical protein